MDFNLSLQSGKELSEVFEDHQPVSLKEGRLLKRTLSICPHCLERIDAKVFERSGEVWMDKTCPQHGHFSALLARVSPVSHPEQFPGRSGQRSYWINTYNTLVVQAVLELWPMESVQDVKISFSSRLVPGKGFFYERKVVVGGEETNLYQLEKNILSQQKDPRLHFAFNCASNSCPVLRPWEWTEEQLDTAAHDFINDSDNVQVQDGRIYLSRIFKWYKKDFPVNLLEYLQGYAGPTLAKELQKAIEQGYRLSYRSYDWSLNDGG
jgi:hypothetical protein